MHESPKIELSEPGFQALVICLQERWSTGRIVGVGRQTSNHIPMIVFRDPPQALSRIQITIIGVVAAEGIVLWVRDGGPNPDKYLEIIQSWPMLDGQPDIGSDQDWKPSTYKSWINNEELSPWAWTQFRVGDILSFGRQLQHQPIAGYFVKHAVEDTGTNQEAGTVSYNAAEVWRQESRRCKTEGTLLLTVPSPQKNFAIIQEIDSTAELMLGAAPGELQEAEKTITLQDQFLFEQEDRISEMVGEAMVYDRSFVGRFTSISGKDVSLTLRRRSINGQPYVLFGWLAMHVVVIPTESTNSGDWKAKITEWANAHPLLAAVALVVTAIAVVIVKLVLLT
ncbi:hypothetical protein Lepto7375DRAFT_1766 [Leptolyngbya sp. PCC 7375]|nr:hypothetical protein Lepto7375DRAFT_1766 [Leptolyngbya sp. PCC 7375]